MAIMRDETFGPAVAMIKLDRTRKQRVCAQDWNTGQVSMRCRLAQLMTSPLYAMVIHR
jgi:hypothetical protein